MGCAFSKAYENNPRIFSVWNVDSDGRHLRPGKIEVTDTQLILYQKTNIVVRWPLTSLRRYGFDSEVFSFECGRRCTTGAGVYAFKCRRAQALFSILQECINNINISDNAANNTYADELFSAATVNAEPSANQPHSTSSNLQNGHHILNIIQNSTPSVDALGYLQPNTAPNEYVPYELTAPVPNNNSTAGSPGGYVCIQGYGSTGSAEGMTSEWPSMPSSFPSCCSLGNCGRRSMSASAGTHHYVNNEVIEQGASCSNAMCIVNRYVNQSVIAADLTHRCCSPTRCCAEHNKNTYVNSAMVTLSSGHLPCSAGACSMDCTYCVDLNTNYAKLDDLLKQEQSAKKHKDHFYVNVKTDSTAHSSSTSSKCVSGRSSPTEVLSRCGTMTTPTSPNSTKVLKSHCYANTGSPTTSEATSSKEQAQVTYAILDLYQSDSGNSNVVSPASTQNSVHSLAGSPIKSPEGYAQIDFDKTVALSNSANPCAILNDDSLRKTRHNAVSPAVSMTV